MALDIILYVRMDLVRNMFVLPAVNFTYDFFHWVKPLPEPAMHVLMGFMFVCALAIAAGVFFRPACRLFAGSLFYLLLLDKSIYNNHIYLFVLLALLLSFTDADRALSFRRSGRSIAGTVPRWQLGILQLQLLIVYTYGGIAKLTHDWLVRAQPVRTMAEGLSADNMLFRWLKTEGGIALLNYGGLVVDLGAPLLLMYRPIRKWGIWIYVAFNVLNSQLFHDIGIFPFVMLFSLTLFVEVEKLSWFSGAKSASSSLQARGMNKTTHPVTSAGWPRAFAFLVPYFIFQLLFPFRGFFLPNPLDWTTIGNKFSWRMKVDTRQVTNIGFFVLDPQSQTYMPTQIQTLVNTMQLQHLSMDPRSVLQFARFLKAKALAQGIREPLVTGHVKVKYNGRQEQDFFDPATDLGNMRIRWWKKAEWVNPVIGTD